MRALLARGDLLGAEAAGSALLQNYSGNEDLHFGLGQTLARNFMPLLALPHLQRAAARRPNDGGILTIYGAALTDAGEMDAALEVLENAVRRDNQAFMPQILLGRLHAQANRRDLAERHFRKGIALAPTSRRSALEAQLLDLQIGWGDLEDVAAALADRVEDGSATPHQLARFVRLRVAAGPGQAATLLARQLADPKLDEETRTELLHARAALLEKSGRTAEAFATLLAAKARMPGPDDPSDFNAYVDRMTGVMRRAPIVALSERIGDPGFRPIFIAGMPRSGTTLTEQILSAHSSIGGAGEAGSLREVLLLLSHSGAAHGDSLETTMNRVGFDRIARLRDGIRTALLNRAGGGAMVVDKTPQNFMTIHLILVLFPKARIIHCFREPADNFISAFRLNMGPGHEYTRTPQSYARFYASYARLMRHWHREFPEWIFPLHYEGLVTAPEPKIRAMLQFLDLPWEPACLAPQNNTSRVTTPSMYQVRQPINPRSIGAAHPFAAQIGDAFSPSSVFAPCDRRR